MFSKLICFVFAVNTIIAVELPSYIEKCQADEFESCLVRNGNKALSILLKGDKALNIPSFSPLKIDIIKINSASLQIALKNVEFYGLDSMRIASFTWRPPFGILVFSGNSFTITGNQEPDAFLYDINLPREGLADITLEAVNITIIGVVHMERNVRNKTTFSLSKVVADLSPQNTIFTITNMQNAPRLYIRNSEELSKPIVEMFEKEIAGGFAQIVNRLGRLFDYEDLILA